MRRDDHADDLLRAHAEGEYVFPDYGGYCFAGVPGTALSALDAAPEDVPTLPGDVFAGVDTEGVENVVVLLVDGFGYDQWCRAEDTDYLETTLLGRLSERGTVTPLTACFPSETAAAVPTVHTGQYAAEHGQLGWWQYVPEIGARVQTLPYVTGEGEPVRQVYPDAPAPSKTLYDADSLYDDVAPEVSTSLFEPSDISGADEQTFSAGASRYVGSENAAQLAVQLRRTLEGSSGEKYCYAYFPQVDAASHREGPHAAATDAQLEAVLGALRRELLERCSTRVAERTLVVVTADHGHVDTEGENVDIRGYGPIWDNLATGPDGNPIPPVGSSRQVQLHLQDETVEAVRSALERNFDCRTFTREEYEERGLFGPVVGGESGGRGSGSGGDNRGGSESNGNAYERHAPDLVCVHREKGMWDDDTSLNHVGKHGGLTRAEMLVPFAAARLSDLQGE
ncbi:alkaline phosphatase family protein [Halospeciosus flavus]|uniref:Alkaline phosphatase family protein n=1 Tax=Halospeciosus flavus TaxID=3032283 RepID=A0ABD5Z2F3_9EURY|nr:alkaline phosphatase family protein [Halospeciosus flavus]